MWGPFELRGFASYLPQFGWRPYVLTKMPSTGNNGQAVKEAYDTFLVPSIPLNKPFHLESFIWVPFMVRKAAEIMRKVPIEAVLISCPPFHQATAGVLLKKWFGTKLVVDYRDGWGLNPYRQRLSSFRRFVLQGDKLLEHYLLRNASLLIVSHQEMKNQYLRHFEFLKGGSRWFIMASIPKGSDLVKRLCFPSLPSCTLGTSTPNRNKRPQPFPFRPPEDDF